MKKQTFQFRVSKNITIITQDFKKAMKWAEYLYNKRKAEILRRRKQI